MLKKNIKYLKLNDSKCRSGDNSKSRSFSGNRSWFGTEPHWILVDFINFRHTKNSV